ncbi:MAG TPA: DUF192 domain-containing protein [Fimbriimonadaceae bacterium]|nr:DUF192 domain-containing protein [Fimbriimonadaceae bacterium]
MRQGILLVATLLLWGCKDEPTVVASAPENKTVILKESPSEAKQQVQRSLPEQKTTSATQEPSSGTTGSLRTSPGDSATTQKKPPEPSDPKATAQNPNRVYQLSELKTTTLSLGKHSIKAWIMDDNSKRMEGMMFLKDRDVKIEQGMLFVFPDEDERSFWMHNTLIPLDIAYIAKSGRIVSTARLRALDETGVPSNGAAMYVLEMKAGAFAKFGVKKGMQVGIPKDIRAAD